MPSITFVLPHWAYWAALIVFPLIAMVMARRTIHDGPAGYSLPLAYFIWATGGILGLHRYYLKSLYGLLYLPLFLFILYSNAQERDARVELSNTTNIVQTAAATVERNAKRIAEGPETLAELSAALEAAEPGSFTERSAQRKLDRETKRIDSARERTEIARADIAAAEPQIEVEAARQAFWGNAAFYSFMAILAFMVLDAAMMPSMLKRAAEKLAAEGEEEEPEVEQQIEAVEEAERKADHEHISTGWTGVIDRLSFFAGEFVSYWAVIAVFVYYFEVIARYVFNSPTNWAHEGMYLMFGMQYLVCGAYAMLTEAHVRVDIFYQPLSARRKALVDILTSVFFFIFAGTLLVTGYIFAMDATIVNEVSFTEWLIAYWPFKWLIFVGALLLVLQGISKLAQDIATLVNGEPAATAEA